MFYVPYQNINPATRLSRRSLQRNFLGRARNFRMYITFNGEFKKDNQNKIFHRIRKVCPWPDSNLGPLGGTIGYIEFYSLDVIISNLLKK